MNRIITLCTAAAISGLAVAQPTLTAANNVPSGGDVFSVSIGTSTNNGTPGANQLWGFWALMETGAHDIRYYDASVSGSSASMPTATLLGTDGGTDTAWYAVTANGLEQVGERTSLGLAPYSDGILRVKYPCTYNTAWSDNSFATYTTFGQNVTRTGTIDALADGYGTLQLPSGEFTNVLRVYARQVIDDQSILATVHRTFDSYYFYVDTVPFPILKFSTDTTIFSGGSPAVSRSAEWMYGVHVGIGELGNNISFQLYPNPANELVTLDLTAFGGRPVVLSVTDALGRVVLNENVRAAARHTLDTQAFAPGCYTATITDAIGARNTVRFVRE